MKLLGKEYDDSGRTILVCESRFLFWKRTRRFLAQSQLTPSFWAWLELPGRYNVPDSLSFQLDAWNRE